MKKVLTVDQSNVVTLDKLNPVKVYIGRGIGKLPAYYILKYEPPVVSKALNGWIFRDWSDSCYGCCGFYDTMTDAVNYTSKFCTEIVEFDTYTEAAKWIAKNMKQDSDNYQLP